MTCVIHVPTTRVMMDVELCAFVLGLQIDDGCRGRPLCSPTAQDKLQGQKRLVLQYYLYLLPDIYIYY